MRNYKKRRKTLKVELSFEEETKFGQKGPRDGRGLSVGLFSAVLVCPGLVYQLCLSKIQHIIGLPGILSLSLSLFVFQKYSSEYFYIKYSLEKNTLNWPIWNIDLFFYVFVHLQLRPKRYLCICVFVYCIFSRQTLENIVFGVLVSLPFQKFWAYMQLPKLYLCICMCVFARQTAIFHMRGLA